MLQPVKLKTTGQTDANGNGLLDFKSGGQLPRQQFEAVVNLTTQLNAPGNAAWTLLLNGDLPLFPTAYGNGVNMGPFHLAPGDYVTLSITNGPANVQGITANLAGVESQDVHEVLPLLGGTANVSSNLSSLGLQVIKQTGGGVGGGGPVNVPVPPNTVAIGYAIEGAGLGFLTSLSITGHVTGSQYAVHSTTGGPGGTNIIQSTPFAALLNPQDTSVDIRWAAGAGGVPTIDVIAWQQATANWVQTPPGQPLLVSKSGNFNVPALWETAIGVQSAPSNGSLFRKIAAGAVGTFTMLAGVANKYTYVFWWEIVVESGSGAVYMEETSAGGFFANNSFGPGARDGNLNGSRLPLGAGVQLHIVTVGGGGISVNAVVSASQES